MTKPTIAIASVSIPNVPRNMAVFIPVELVLACKKNIIEFAVIFYS
jgi:hypothetical protein